MLELTELRASDPGFRDGFEAWYVAHRAATTAGRRYPASWTHDEMLHKLSRPTSHTRFEAYALTDRDHAGRIVATILVQLPTSENVDNAYLEVAVPPELRRRGHGSAAARVAREITLRHGRRRIIAEAVEPLGDSGDRSNGDHSTGALRFATANGYRVCAQETHRVLESPRATEDLDRLAQAAAAHHEAYRLVTWYESCPDDLIDAYAGLMTRFTELVPTGDLDHEPQSWTAARIREAEQGKVAQGRDSFVTAALAPDGAMAGVTELVRAAHGEAFQNATVVLPEHQGRRLGIATKVANHRAFQTRHPAPAIVHTWNNETNGPMNAVNELLGYLPVETVYETQLTI